VTTQWPTSVSHFKHYILHICSSENEGRIELIFSVHWKLLHLGVIMSVAERLFWPQLLLMEGKLHFFVASSAEICIIFAGFMLVSFYLLLCVIYWFFLRVLYSESSGSKLNVHLDLFSFFPHKYK
jgi:hypothetical protein